MIPLVLCWALASFAALAQQSEAPREAMPVFRADARLVEVYASVLDKRGNPLPSIAADRFRVYDNGQLQKLVAFEGADDSLSCALLLDVTGSMDSFLPALKYAAMKFVDDLRDGEAVAVYSFSATLKVGQEFSSDKKLVKQAVMRTRAGGATALFDALSVVSRDTAARKGKKALIVFTDGDDNASALSAVSASRQARRSGVPIYAIAQGSALKNASLLKILEELAADTGGIAFRLDRTDKIGAVFAEISRNLRHTYSFSWTLPEDAGSTWRSIKISVAGLDSARIRAREGYWPR